MSQKVLKASESGALKTLKSKWWPEGDCTDAAVVGSSAEKSMEVDIPHVGKFWTKFDSYYRMFYGWFSVTRSDYNGA